MLAQHVADPMSVCCLSRCFTSAVAGELLLLMVFLDKFWFGPVGKVLDERDAKLRSQLGTVKDGSSELARLTSGEC